MTTCSVFDLFKIGIGPSSSHTVGPMKGAARFVQELVQTGSLSSVTRICCELYGSLALTGKGHATDIAILLGLQGELPATVELESIATRIAAIRTNGVLRVAGMHEIPFNETRDLLFRGETFLERHPNGMKLEAWGTDNRLLHRQVYYSLGGGFVVNETEAAAGLTGIEERQPAPPYAFGSSAELLEICRTHSLAICDVLRANEETWQSRERVDAGLDEIWHVMEACIRRGCETSGELPGGLRVKRRAAAIARRLNESQSRDPLVQLDWVSLFALAVNEENAAGGRVVTAPTNGAAGVIPAVIGYYTHFIEGANVHGVRNFLLTAAAIGMLYKRNASLSAAEMGCQGEVGVACSMAAAGLAAVMGGSNSQIENAAEIGMEHHLGLTCDPVAGLVQIPCIERNTMGAAKAINAARLAVLYGDGSHRVSLDRVIETMRQTGRDMQDKYKETSRGGLALNVVDC